MVRCAPQSLIAQCSTQPPIRSLRPAPQLMSAVQRLCNGTAATAPPAATAAAAADDGRAGVAAAASAAAPEDMRVGVAAAAMPADGSAALAGAAAADGSGAAGTEAVPDAVLEDTCSTCSATSPSADKVVVQATNANCPDPLGALRALRLLCAACRVAGGSRRSHLLRAPMP